MAAGTQGGNFARRGYAVVVLVGPHDSFVKGFSGSNSNPNLCWAADDVFDLFRKMWCLAD